MFVCVRRIIHDRFNNRNRHILTLTDNGFFPKNLCNNEPHVVTAATIALYVISDTKFGRPCCADVSGETWKLTTKTDCNNYPTGFIVVKFKR